MDERGTDAAVTIDRQRTMNTSLIVIIDFIHQLYTRFSDVTINHAAMLKVYAACEHRVS